MHGFDNRNSKGRFYRDKEGLLPATMQDPFLADFIKIIQSKSFRRLKDKTQVVSFPVNSHVRDRSAHSLEVVAGAASVADSLNLNINLCMAIAAGHDLGHIPYGHHGEVILSKLIGKKFRHNEFSLVVPQEIETKGEGLNLTHETLEGILLHSRGKSELISFADILHEYNVVMLVDKIEYIFADISDAINRLGYSNLSGINSDLNKLGFSARHRVDTCLKALIKESRESGIVSFSKGYEFELFSDAKSFMYEHVYEKIPTKVRTVLLTETYDFFKRNYKDINPGIALALCTDSEVKTIGLSLESGVSNKDILCNLGILEILPYLKGKNNFKYDLNQKKEM